MAHPVPIIPVTPLPPLPPVLGPPLSALDAANELLALPWPGYVGSQVAAAAEATRASLEGKKLINAHGGVGNYGWDFAIAAKNVQVDFDVINPPGFDTLPTIGPNASFAMKAPLNGSWHLRISGDLTVGAEVKLAGVTAYSNNPIAVPWGFGVEDLQLAVALGVDGTNVHWPILKKVSIQPQLSLKGTGAIPFDIGVGLNATIAAGVITFKSRLTDVSVGVGNDFDAKLTGDITVVITPGPTVSVGISGIDLVTVPTVNVQVTFNAKLSFQLPEIGGGLSDDFGFSMNVTIPSPEALNQFLNLTETNLPPQIGVLANGQVPHGGQTPHPTAVVINYDQAACDIEQAALKYHVPYGAVFSTQHQRQGVPLWSELQFYCVEEDSSIWTGHFLAAAAYRYAATSDPEALTTVKRLLGGIEQLVFVTGDAVVKDAKRYSVKAPEACNIFARSTLPDDSGVRWWEADGNIANGRSYYERPEGGWEVVPAPGSRTKALHFGTYAEVENYLNEPKVRGKSFDVRPLGRVWCGVGCGGKMVSGSCNCTADHPVSRDQYCGVFLGLFSAFQFVADDNVRTRAAKLITTLLQYLLDNKWNVPLPHDDVVCTSYLGAFDHQLAFLRIGKTVNPAQFQAVYDHYSAGSAVTWLPIWISCFDPLSQYYKFNLSHAVAGPVLVAEDNLILRQNYLLGYNILRTATAHHRNAYFNLVRILVELPAQRSAEMAAPSGSNPAISLAQEIQSTLAEWLKRRELIEADDGLPTDRIADPSYQLSLWPQAILHPNLDGSKIYISPFALPVDKRLSEDYMWQTDPFSLGFQYPRPSSAAPTVQEVNKDGDPTREAPGIDYLLAYALAIYLGVLPKPVS